MLPDTAAKALPASNIPVDKAKTLYSDFFMLIPSIDLFIDSPLAHSKSAVFISASWFFSKEGFANHMPLLQCHVKQGIRTHNVNGMFLFASLWGRGALLLCKKHSVLHWDWAKKTPHNGGVVLNFIT